VYNDLLNICYKFGEKEKAYSIVDFMREHGPKPDHKTYGVLIKVMGRAREPESILKILQELESSDLHNAEVYSCAIEVSLCC
jgi:pentatricopeptide repeat protein